MPEKEVHVLVFRDRQMKQVLVARRSGAACVSASGRVNSHSVYDTARNALRDQLFTRGMPDMPIVQFGQYKIGEKEVVGFYATQRRGFSPPENSRDIYWSGVSCDAHPAEIKIALDVFRNYNSKKR